jgi:hypothetical protein
MIRQRGLSLTALGVALLGLTLFATTGRAEEIRVDQYDKTGQRTGHVVVDSTTGRLDQYDTHSRRGWGQIQTPTGPGTGPARVDLYRLDGRRQGAAELSPPARRGR